MCCSQCEVQGAQCMTIQEVINKAREGGYEHEFTHREPGLRAGVLGLHAFRTIHVDDFFLDPEFWRALGRTLER